MKQFFGKKKLAKLVTLSVMTGAMLGIASGAWAEEYTSTIEADGEPVVLVGNNTVFVSGSGDRIRGIMVNNGGSVTNSEGTTLSVTVVDQSTSADSRADGIVLWNDSFTSVPATVTSVNLYGLTGIAATGMDAHGVDVWENSVAKIVGKDEANITVNALGTKGEAYGVQVGDTGPASAIIDGFKSISAYSQNGYARTLNIVGGSIVVNGVEAISAYGGLDPVDPNYVGQYGLAYAVQGAGGNIDINGNNTVITATTKGSNTVGVAAGWNSVVRADGIKSITTKQENGTVGQYSYAAGIEADGLYGDQSALYLNKEQGSPYADISVTASNTTVYGINAVNGGILQANLKDVTFSGLTVYGLYSTGKLDVCISGNLSATATGLVRGIVSESADSVETVTGTGENIMSITASGSGNAYGVYTTAGSVTLKDIGSMTVTSGSGMACAIYSEGGTTTLDGVGNVSAVSASGSVYSVVALSAGAININGKDADNKTVITGNVIAQDGGSITLKNTAVIGNISEAKYSTENYGTIKFLGTNTVDGAVTLYHNQSVTAVADSYSLTQVGTDATDTIKINGNVSVSDEGSSIAITGKVPTVEGNVKTYYANITGTATAGAGASLSLTNVEVGGTVTNNGTMNINGGKLVDVATVNDGSVTNITGDVTAHSIASQRMGVTNINKDLETGTVNVEATVTGNGDTAKTGITFQGVKATGRSSPATRGGKMYIGGENLNVNIVDDTTGNYVAVYGVHTSTNTEDFTEDADQGYTVINAKNTNVSVLNSSGDVTLGGVAFTVMSKGILDVDSNLTAKAGCVLVTRGGAKTTINETGDHWTKIYGDIEFENDQEAKSGTNVDALVDLNLISEQSEFVGKIDVRQDVTMPPSATAFVSGMKMVAKDGAKIHLTGDSFVNSLTVDKSTLTLDGNLLIAGVVAGSSANPLHVANKDDNGFNLDTSKTMSGQTVKSQVNKGEFKVANSTITGKKTGGSVVELYGTGTLTDSTVEANVVVASDAVLTVNGNVRGMGNMTLAGKLNLRNGDTPAFDDKLTMTGTFTASGDAKIAFDAKIGAAEAVTSDSISVDTATGTITMDTANIVVENDTSAVGSKKVITLFTGTDLSGLTITGDAIATSDGYKYDFKQDETNKGNLVTTKDYGGTLPQIVQNNPAGLGKVATYILTSDYTTPADLGTLTRVETSTPREFTINGNNHKLLGDSKNGVKVNAGDTLNLKDISEISGWNGYVADNAGTVNISNTSTNTTTLNSVLKGAGAYTNSGSLKVDNPYDNLKMTNGLKNTGTLTLGGGTLGVAITDAETPTGTTIIAGDLIASIDITQKGLTINSGKSLYMTESGKKLTIADGVINGGTLTIGAGDLKSKVANNNTVVLDKDGILATGTTITGGMVDVKANVIANGTDIAGYTTITSGNSLTLIDGTITVGNSANSFKLNEKADVIANGKLIIDKATVVSATSAQIFDVGIVAMSEADAIKYDEYATIDEQSHSEEAKGFVDANDGKKASGFNANISNLTFTAGSLQLEDKHYTLDYVKSAKEVLSKCTTSLIMMGDLVQYTPEGETVNKVIVDQIDDGSDEEEVTTYDKVTAETINGSLLVGTNEVLKQEKAVEIVQEETKITVRDTSATSLSVNQLNLQQKQPTDTFDGVVITNKKSITVGGSQQAGETTELMIVSDVAGEQIKNNPLKVVVGLPEEIAKDLNGVTDKVGTLNIGNENAEATNNYKLNGSIIINKDSQVNVKGQTEITQEVALNDATLNVMKDSVLTTPEVKLTGENNLGGEGKLVTPLFQLDDSFAHVSQATVVEAKNITVDSTPKDNQSKNSVITGKVTAESLQMKQADGTAEDKTVVLNVGTEEKSAVVDVKTTELDGNMLFLDPAWVNGVGLEGASHYATETTNLDGAYVVGRNSILTFGATNADADALFGSTGLDWGKEKVSAAAYVAKSINVTNGSLMVDGSLEKAPNMPAVGSVNFAANSLLMVAANICTETEGAIEGITDATVADGAKLYLDGIEVGTYKVLGVSGTVNGWAVDEVLANSLVAVEKVEEKANDGFYVTFRNADVDFSGTVVPNVAQQMVQSAEGTAAHETIKSMMSDLFTDAQKAANVNTYANLGENLGVSRGAYDVANMVGNAVTEHWDNNAKGENIWAVYTHSKNKVDGLKLGGMDAQYDAQYNGVTVGYDINKDFGIALNHVDGNVSNGYGGHNDAKYYGGSIYGRKVFGNWNLFGDLTYTHGKNELAQGGIEADAKTNTISAGLTAKYLAKAGKYDKIGLFAGARYIHINGRDYTDSLGVNREADKINSVVVPVGLEYTGAFKMAKSAWTFKPVVAVGYLFNLGDRENDMTMRYGGAEDIFGYDFVDNGAFFTHAGMDFEKKNFTLGISYDFMKSKNSKNNRWNVNMNYAF